MATKEQLKDFFKSSLKDVVIAKLNYESEDQFTATLKAKVDKNADAIFFHKYCNDWIKQFGIISSTGWIVRNSYPKVVRMVFRKKYACHLSSFNKVKRTSLEEPLKNQDCRAIICFKVAKCNRNTARNDPYIRKNLNLTVTIEFVHTHLVQDPGNYNFLRSIDVVVDEFHKHFDEGYSVGDAKRYREMLLTESSGPEALANNMFNPKTHRVQYIYNKHRDSGNLKKMDRHELMATKKQELEAAGGALIYSDDNEIVVIITATMKRVFLSSEPSVPLFIDTTEASRCNVTYYYVPSKIGALPIACALHMKNSTATYNQIYETVRQTLENNENEKIFFYDVVLTNDSKQQGTAVAMAFPNSERFSFRFEIFRKIWVSSFGETGMMRNALQRNRHELMAMIRQMMYAATLDEAQQWYELIISKDYLQNYVLKKIIETVWEKRNQWWISPEHERWDGNVMELTITLMKETIIQQSKTFSMSVMMDVVANIFDSHFNRLIASALSDSLTNAFRTKFLKSIDIAKNGADFQTISSKEFRFHFTGKTRKTYIFRLDTLCCDCHDGSKGQICEHLCAVINSMESELNAVPKLSVEDREYLGKICAKEYVEEARNVKVEQGSDGEPSDDNDSPENDLHEAADPDLADFEDDNYYSLEVKKTEPINDDPLEEEEEPPPKPKLTREEFKEKYENGLKAFNNECRRLSNLLKRNANTVNLDAMQRLTNELKKIKPVERVNLKDILLAFGQDDDDCDNDGDDVPLKKRKLDDE